MWKLKMIQAPAIEGFSHSESLLDGYFMAISWDINHGGGMNGPQGCSKRGANCQKITSLSTKFLPPVPGVLRATLIVTTIIVIVNTI